MSTEDACASLGPYNVIRIGSSTHVSGEILLAFACTMKHDKRMYDEIRC